MLILARPRRGRNEIFQRYAPRGSETRGAGRSDPVPVDRRWDILGSEAQVDAPLLQVADEEGDDGEEGQEPDQAPPQGRVLGDDGSDRALDRVVDEVGGQGVLAEG